MIHTTSGSSKKEYEDFYSKSDFWHFGWSDRIFVKAITERYQIEGMSMKLLDLGCGTGWYTYLFNSVEVQAYGIDISETAIRIAKERYGARSYLIGDGLALPFSVDSFDVIFCSGFPPFNAEDLNTLTGLGRMLFSYLHSGGIFIFHKTTDLSGCKTSRMNHTLETYEQYFAELKVGSIIGCYAVSPLGWALLGRWALSSAGTVLTRLFTRLTRIPLRALIVVRKQPVFEKLEG